MSIGYIKKYYIIVQMGLVTTFHDNGRCLLQFIISSETVLGIRSHTVHIFAI